MFSSIVVGWFLAFGWVPQQQYSVNYGATSITGENIATSATVGLDVLIDDRFRVYSNIENYQYKDSRDFRFNPYRVDYTFGMDLIVNSYITLSATHECIHSVRYTSPQLPGFEGSETKVSATIHGETKVR